MKPLSRTKFQFRAANSAISHGKLTRLQPSPSQPSTPNHEPTPRLVPDTWAGRIAETPAAISGARKYWWTLAYFLFPLITAGVSGPLPAHVSIPRRGGGSGLGRLGLPGVG